MQEQPSNHPDLPHAPFIWRDVRILREIWPAYVPNWLICRSNHPAALEVDLDYVLYDVDLADSMFFYGTVEDIDSALGPEVRGWLANPAYLHKAGQSLSTPSGTIRGLPLATILARIHGKDSSPKE
jgi:hypothetical protein